MVVSNTPYEFSCKAMAQSALNKNSELVPYNGHGFVNACGNGAYYVILLRDKNNNHVGFLNY